MIGRMIGTGVAAAALVLLAAGCSSDSEKDESERDESGEIVDGGDVGVFRLQVGDCLAELPSGSVEAAAAVPCADEHAAEVYAAFDLPGEDGAEFPGETAVNDDAGAGCLDRFKDFVGIRYERSSFGILPISPSEESWDQVDDREVLCLLAKEDGSMVSGSAEGTRE